MRDADIGTIRVALFDVIDAGDPNSFDGWLFYKAETERQTVRRTAFVDAVVARIAELQSQQRYLFCSCGGALTDAEYAEHVARGHDRGL